MVEDASHDGWEPLFRTLFEGSQRPMALLDIETRDVVDVNDACCALVGREHEDVVGRNVDEFVVLERLSGPRLTPEDVSPTQDHLGETVVADADGNPLRLQYVARGTEVEGRPLVLIVVAAVEADDEDVPSPARGPLTPREGEIVHLVALGLNSREIADRLYLSHQTVRTHVQNAMGKTGAHTRAHLVAIALSDRALATPD